MNEDVNSFRRSPELVAAAKEDVVIIFEAAMSDGHATVAAPAQSFDAFGMLGSTAGWVGLHDDLSGGISAGLVQDVGAVECMPYATGAAMPVVVVRSAVPVIVTRSGITVSFIRNEAAVSVIRNFTGLVIRPRRTVVVRGLTRHTSQDRAPTTRTRPRARRPRTTRTKHPLRPRSLSSDASPPAPPGRRARRDRPATGLSHVAKGAASFQYKSSNGKLSPVEGVPTTTRPRPTPRGPFVCSTYVSIDATCSNACAFKEAGCYVRSGFTGSVARKLDGAARGRTSLEVIREEVRLIDGAFRRGVPQDGARGGRDLRLHVGGDVKAVTGARLLAEAARRWLDRGGGAVWTFTHAWREIPRRAWGPAISVLASVERPEDIEAARKRGYAAAIVVPEFPSKKAFVLPGSTARIIPCPAETMGTTCVECRLCLDRDLLGMHAAIAFEAHGPGAKAVREQLVQLRAGKNATVLNVRSRT